MFDFRLKRKQKQLVTYNNVIKIIRNFMFIGTERKKNECRFRAQCLQKRLANMFSTRYENDCKLVSISLRSQCDPVAAKTSDHFICQGFVRCSKTIWWQNWAVACGAYDPYAYSASTITRSVTFFSSLKCIAHQQRYNLDILNSGCGPFIIVVPIDSDYRTNVCIARTYDCST